MSLYVAGRDCYVASRLVGEAGFVTGIDMTPEQLAVANKYREQYTREVCGYKQPNMRFVQVGWLEGLRHTQIHLSILSTASPSGRSLRCMSALKGVPSHVCTAAAHAAALACDCGHSRS